jgi:arginine decarboxylase
MHSRGVVRKNGAEPANNPILRSEARPQYITVGNRIPREYFVTRGRGESEITVHAGSYHLALQQAGIEMCNIITYSSILPAIAQEVPRPAALTHGSVMETIMATATSNTGERATAGLVLGWLYEKRGGDRYGGLVCEYSGHQEEEQAQRQLHASLAELYESGYADRFLMEGKQLMVESFVPRKRYGTVVVGLCFLSYLWPALGREAPALLPVR